MLNWREELCSSRPDELAQVGRDSYIQRRNIAPYEKTGADGQKETGYTCESRIISREQYFALKEQEETAASVEDNFLTTMAAQAEIYEKLAATEENQLIIMQGIAELYEKGGE